MLIANGQEAQYTFSYISAAGGEASPQDIGDCETFTDAVHIRIVQLTANTATLGFTAAAGHTPMAFDWECDDGSGSGSGGSGSGGTGDPTPNIDSISPVPLIVGIPTTVMINGENFGTSSGDLLWGGTGNCQQGDANWSDTTITVSVTASNPGYCTVAVSATTDAFGNSFLAGAGSSPESEPFILAVATDPADITAVSIVLTRQSLTQVGATGSPTCGTFVASTTTISEYGNHHSNYGHKLWRRSRNRFIG